MDTRFVQIKNTLQVWFFTFLKIPLIWKLRPVVRLMSSEKTIISISLRRLTKNHLNSMYFGVLAIGSEMVVATKALQAILQSGLPVDFVFKDFSIQCLKRAEGEVHFICDEGLAVDELLKKAIHSGLRETQTFSGYGLVPSVSLNDRVVTFQVTLSLKQRVKK